MCIARVPNAEGWYGMRVRYGDMTNEMAFTPGSARRIFHAIAFSTVACYEDKPVVHGIKSLVRRAIWDAGTLYHRVLLTSGNGCGVCGVMQNMLTKAVL